MFKVLVDRFDSLYRQWIDRRIPSAQSVTLDQRRIFIFPSRAGFAFLGLLLVMLIAAINYQNNMAFALVFLLACVFFISVLHTFANLSGLTIKALGAKASFVGDSIPFKLQLSRHGAVHYYDINLSWAGCEKQLVCLVDNNELVLSLNLLAEKRGYFKPGRLLIETFYPVGLLRAWTWVALEFDALVYPQPLPAIINTLPATEGEEGEAILVNGSDDFYGFRDYYPGDSLKHVFWRGYAKGQELQVKQYAGYREKQLWLDWDTFDGVVEKRLSHLCYWALKLEHDNQEYGLRLPGQEMAPAKGVAHQLQVLRALALYEAGDR